MVPVKKGSTVLLLPIIIGEGARVDGKSVEKLDYICLRQQAPTEQDLWALLLFSESDT
jgi:hypothetical protein